jgi:hypothetical protein
VRARLVDEVEVVRLPLVSDVPANEDRTFELEEIFGDWCAAASSLRGQDADWVHEFAMTLIAGGRTTAAELTEVPRSQAQQFERFRSWADTADHIHSWQEVCNKTSPCHYQEPTSEATSNGYLYGIEAEQVCKFRTFFITKKGRFGLGPALTAPGSSICLIHGLRTPFILEKQPEENCYKLGGECYVHGLMDGAVLESDMDSDIVLV